MQKHKLFLMIAIIIIFIVSFIGTKGEMIEKLGIPSGVATDIENTTEGIIYNSSYLVYSFEEEENISNDILKGTARSIPETRENRQLKAGYRIMVGLSRVYIYSEEAARAGMINYMDINISSAELNDRALVVVCKGKAEDILKFNVKGYPNSLEFIEGMVKNLRQYNFFPMEYTNVDFITRIGSEGRTPVVPYIEIKDGNLETTGIALFDGEKMVDKIDMYDTEIINLLKNDKVNGMLTLQQDEKRYINCYAHSKRKVKCYKDSEKLKFVIDLDLKGDIVANTEYKNLNKDIVVLKEYERNMQKYIEKRCYEVINNIKYKYKIDALSMGKFAAAKYGRGTGTDWNEAVCNSDIQVNVKFSIDTEGKGGSSIND